MDKNELHVLLGSVSEKLHDKKIQEQIEELATSYPYFSALQYANFACKSLQPNSNPDINQLGIIKSNPLLFAEFVQNVNQLKSSSASKTETIESEDILALINELPNSNPIAKSSEEKFSLEKEEIIIVTEPEETEEEEDKSLMVMMSFTDWLTHFKTKTEKEKQEQKEKKALKTAWQKEKLAALSEEENEEIPEEIFQQAMDSISEKAIVSESLAMILAKQGKKDKAIEMYKKLSLRNPEKNTYFAARIKELTNNKDF